MAKAIIASVIMASVTIMARVTYGNCDTSVIYGKFIMANVIMAKIFMAKILWQMKLSPLTDLGGDIRIAPQQHLRERKPSAKQEKYL